MERTGAGGRRLHFGFLVVLALIVTSFAPLSLGLSCAGIFYTAVSKSIGVGAGMLSYYTSILWIATIVFLPFFGKLLGRMDARLCLSGVVAVMALDFVWLSFVNALWQFYVGAFVMGIGVTMLLFLAPSTLINRWFAKRAGFFIGLVMAFTGVGGVVWSAVGGALINAVGWQTTYLVFAAITACALPFTLFCVASHPRDKGLRAFGAEAASADGDQGEAAQMQARAIAKAAEREGEGGEGGEGAGAGTHAVADADAGAARAGAAGAGAARAGAAGAGAAGAGAMAAASSAGVPAASSSAASPSATPTPEASVPEAPEDGITAKEAFRMPVFYLLAAMTFLINFGMYVYFIIPSYINSLPLGVAIPLLGATASSAAMLGQTVSKLALGYTGDRHPGPAAAIGVGCGLVGVIMLMMVDASAVFVYAAAFVYGIFYGVTNVMMPILTRRSFGDRDYPAIYSRISMGASAGGVICGFFWGTLIDATGGYTVVFVGTAVCIVGVLVIIAAIERLHRKSARLRRRG